MGWNWQQAIDVAEGARKRCEIDWRAACKTFGVPFHLFGDGKHDGKHESKHGKGWFDFLDIRR
jgi:hypothetical protein